MYVLIIALVFQFTGPASILLIKIITVASRLIRIVPITKLKTKCCFQFFVPAVSKINMIIPKSKGQESESLKTVSLNNTTTSKEKGNAKTHLLKSSLLSFQELSKYIVHDMSKSHFIIWSPKYVI